MFKRTHRLFAAWIALLAVVLSALGPSISHGIASAKGSPLDQQQICTLGGAKLVSLNGAPTPPAKNDPAGLTGHCPYCLLSLLDWAPPSQATHALDVRARPGVLPAPAADESCPRVAWNTPHSRAPPTRS